MDSFLSLKNEKQLLCFVGFYVHLFVWSALSLLMKRSTWFLCSHTFDQDLTQNLFLLLCIDQWWFPVTWSQCTLRRNGEEALWFARTNYWILLLFCSPPLQSLQMLSRILFLRWIPMQAELIVISLFIFKPVWLGFTLTLWNKKLTLIFSSVLCTFLGNSML